MRNRNGHDAKIRRNRIPQAMPEQNRLSFQPLGSCQKHILFPHFIQNFIADHVCVIPQMTQHYDRHRQDQMTDTVRKICLFSNRVGTGTRQPFELHGKNKNQKQRQPEFRNTSRDGSHLTDDAVQPCVFLPCTENSKKQREGENQQKPNAAKHQRISNSSLDHAHYIHFIFVRNSEIPLQRIACPADILYGNGILQSQFFFGPRSFFGRHFFHAVSVI